MGIRRLKLAPCSTHNSKLYPVGQNLHFLNWVKFAHVTQCGLVRVCIFEQTGYSLELWVLHGANFNLRMPIGYDEFYTLILVFKVWSGHS